MTSNEHKSKHAKLARPSVGNYNRNEWAIVGAPCINIKLLADTVITYLSPKYKCAYVDTSHNDEIVLPPGRIANGAFLEYTDQINYQQFNYKEELTPFQLKQQFVAADLVLVNGNHQQAKAQVVVIYENKKASLQKRVEQLTNVELILLDERVDEVFEFVKEAVPNWRTLPIYHLGETERIVAFFDTKMQGARSVLNGLVLAGGKSERMGFDKGAITWHGKPQRYHIADLLENYCKDVFLSCRVEQRAEIEPSVKIIEDTFTGLGPMGAILSAFRENPDQALLVVACDLPLLNDETLKYLVTNRNTSSIATAYASEHDGHPEPLITIWEPKSYPVLLHFLSLGYSCPRKVLINSDITLLQPKESGALTNVNNPEDMDKVKRILHQQMATPNGL